MSRINWWRVRNRTPGRPGGRHPLAGPGPLLGQVQPDVDQRVLAAGDVGQVHPDLAVLQLPEPPAPLPLHPDRGRALLGEGRRVEHQHGVRLAQLNPDLPGQLGLQAPVVPVGLADELLKALPLPVVQVGDRLDVLRPEVRQEALDVAGGVAAPGVGPEGRGERPDEPLQAGGHAPQQARVDPGVVE